MLELRLGHIEEEIDDIVIPRKKYGMTPIKIDRVSLIVMFHIRIENIRTDRPGSVTIESLMQLEYPVEDHDIDKNGKPTVTDREMHACDYRRYVNITKPQAKKILNLFKKGGLNSFFEINN